MGRLRLGNASGRVGPCSFTFSHFHIPTEAFAWRYHNPDGKFVYEAHGVRVDGVALGPYAEVGIAACLFFQSGEEIKACEEIAEQNSQPFLLNSTDNEVEDAAKRCISYLSHLQMQQKTSPTSKRSSSRRL